jgi:pimeloyl-ACP methyl ester carboxylesterase
MTAVVIDGCTLHYKLHGVAPSRPAPPLVLTHGAGGNLMHWPGELRRLSGHVVVALDLPGHGRSGPATPPCLDLTRSPEDIGLYAQTAGRFARKLGLGKFVLAGHSMGGAVAQELALREPETIAGLVLVATGARLSVARELLSELEGDHESAVRTLVSWSQGAHPDPNTTRVYLHRLREVDVGVLRNDYAACNGWDRTGEVGRISVPALIIHGDADRLLPLEYGVDLQRRLEMARLVVVPSAGHMVMLEQPALVATEIQQFLATLSQD